MLDKEVTGVDLILLLTVFLFGDLFSEVSSNSSSYLKNGVGLYRYGLKSGAEQNISHKIKIVVFEHFSQIFLLGLILH